MASPSKRVDGIAYGPGSARRVSATLSGTPAATQLCDSDGAVLTTDTARRENRVAGGVSAVTLDSGWRFETEDHTGLDSLLGAADEDWLMRLERPSWLLAGAVLATFAGIFLIWRFGLGVLVAVAIWMTPPQLVRAIDAGNLAALDRTLASPTKLSEAQQHKVTAIFNKIADAAPPPEFGAYHLELRQIRGIGPNALALPGGTIILTDALVQRFDDPDVIAAVLGHEAAHITENHSLKQLYRNLSIYLLVALIAGDVGPVLEDLLLEGGVLLSLSNSRRHEAEADRLGVATAASAGYDPAALIRFFEQLDAMNLPEGPSWRSTHPHSKDRAETIRHLLEDH